ncbi:hypothetical protein B0J11DRAFT_183730 [Dendryphion nanum]|uniref:Zn(2)-C6 fungal-type domain-containing protein n=1 Tax=Dendryphion nanum TaxID=256645 RepID=A0A9P9D5M1_9PLEO|nr:hypothetical protein B0J11DRAFT_183730 [Dendryphion nanum]
MESHVRRSDEDMAPKRRKRNPIACHGCKARKVRCSNDRPQCSSCVRLQCECVYPQESYSPAHTDSAARPAEVDPTLSLILEGIGQILGRLPPGIAASSSMPAPPLSPGCPGATVAPSPETVLFSTTGGADHGIPASSSDLGPAEGLSIDSVLAWPILESNLSTYNVASKPCTTTLFAADRMPDYRDSLERRRRVDSSFISADGDILLLVRRFLTLVNIKNPILNSQSILTDASVVIEAGLSWDPKSCLVLLACSLGAIASPFDPSPATTESFQATSSRADRFNQLRADKYFQAARQRLGLLDRSIQSCQCYLLAGIYSMYIIRPLQAWQFFIQASTVYTAYIKAYGSLDQRSDNQVSVSDPELQSLEQRLYWSCLKTECEIVAEIPLSRSTLRQIDYPYMFPSIPGTLTALKKLPTVSVDTGHEPVDETYLHSQSWLYYLTEITLIRLYNRIVQYFYSDGNRWMSMDLTEMNNIAAQFEKQLHDWKQSLPEPISFTHIRSSPDQYSELRAVLCIRYHYLRKLITRPFLYRTIHSTMESTLDQSIARPLAKSHISDCLEEGSTVMLCHRHHGTFFHCRGSAATAFTLLAATKAGLIHSMGRQSEAQARIQLYIEHLRYWEDESPDILLLREMLTMTYAQIFSGVP